MNALPSVALEFRVMDQAVDPVAERALTIAELLADEALSGAEIVAGRSSVNRDINAVNVMTVPDIGRWVRRGEFLLVTGFPLPREDREQAALVRDLHARGVAGVGVKLDRYMPELSESFTAVAEELNMPVVVIPEHARFDDILSRAFAVITNRQAAALARAQEIHKSFLEITLSGGGLWKLAGRVSALLGEATVTIVDSKGSVLAHANDQAVLQDLGLMTGDSVDVSRLHESDTHAGEAVRRRWAARQIRAASFRHGFVVAVGGDLAFSDTTLVALDQAAVVAALEITRDLAVGAVEQRFSSNVLFELIAGGESEFADATARIATFGWDLERDVVVLVGRQEEGHREQPLRSPESGLAEDGLVQFWSSAVQSHDASAAAAGLGVELVAIMGDEAEVLAKAEVLRSDVARFTRGRFALGVSRAYPGPRNIGLAYQEAKLALRLGRRVSGPEAVTAYADLGLFRLLAQVDDDELHAFAEETLRPLLALTESDRVAMFSTLKALVRHNMNMAETARELHYHYNTLRYRLSKLERLLGPFSTDTEVTIRVCVALMVMEMRNQPSPQV